MWENKESFILWLHEEKERSYHILVRELKKLNYKNLDRDYIYNNLCEIYQLKQSSEWATLCYNQLYKVDEYKNIINNETVDYIISIYSFKDIYKNPKLWEYEEFLICAYHIRRFEKTKLNKIKKEYSREVKQLKKRADEVAKFSIEPIIMVIPRRTQDILSYLRFKLMYSDNLKDFLYFFNYSTKNITIKSYLEFSEDNIKNIASIGKLLNIEQPTAVNYVANALQQNIIINTIKLSKIFNNEVNPFYTVYKSHNIGV